METKASSVPADAILSHKKVDGKIHSVYFANRTMNSAKQNNFDCVREISAVTFTLKMLIICSLYSQPFKLVINY